MGGIKDVSTPADMENTFYDVLQDEVESTFKIQEQVDEEIEAYEGKEYAKRFCIAVLKENKGVIFSAFLYILVGLHLVISVINYAKFLMVLNTGFVSSGLFLKLFFVIGPFLLWTYSTKYDFFNFWNRKMRLFVLCCVHGVVQLCMFLGEFLAQLLFMACVHIPVSQYVTISMICNLQRLLLVILPVLPCVFLLKNIITAIYKPLTKKEIVRFKVTKLFDFRKDVKYAYDMVIVKNLETGRKYVIEEKDRYLHALANGVTGSGKTSSVFTTSIYADIEQIVFNKTAQKKQCQKLLTEGKIRLKFPMDDKDFIIDAFEGVTPEYDKFLQNIKYRMKIAGITAIAPDAPFADTVYDMAHAKGLKVNRIDPVLNTDGFLKPGFCGFNPLLITSGLSETEFIIEASRKAILCADVLQAIFDTGGSSDPYFAGLNKNITTTVAMLLIFSCPAIKKRQPTLQDVQLILNSFSSARPFRDEFVDRYAKRNKKGNFVFEDGHYIMCRPIFQNILDTIDAELLGDGAEKMADQCRGLRNILSTVLSDLNVANVLCHENSIDMDRTLEEAQITVVNFALELGPSGRSLGLFYMLNLINTAYRRPGTEDTRLPNFVYIDEFPQLLHPKEEQCFVLFRKYRLAMFVAMQSLSQFMKDRSTAFMQQVLIGNCAHHFVFGRASIEEMELYQKLAGTAMKITEMGQTNETAMISDNPSVSYGLRQQMSMENRIEGSDIHDRDFQEVTVISVKKGSPVDVFFGKTSFLPRHKTKVVKKLYSVDWSQYYEDEENNKEEKDEVSVVKDELENIMTVTSNDRFEKKTDVENQKTKNVPAFFSQLSAASEDIKNTEKNKSNETTDETIEASQSKDQKKQRDPGVDELKEQIMEKADEFENTKENESKNRTPDNEENNADDSEFGGFVINLNEEEESDTVE